MSSPVVRHLCRALLNSLIAYVHSGVHPGLERGPILAFGALAWIAFLSASWIFSVFLSISAGVSPAGSISGSQVRSTSVKTPMSIFLIRYRSASSAWVIPAPNVVTRGRWSDPLSSSAPGACADKTFQDVFCGKGHVHGAV